MSTILPLDPAQLYRSCDPEQFSFVTTAELEDLSEIIGQTRALDAIRFGSGIQREGYNLFVMGPQGTGKHTFVTQFLEEKAKQEPVPSDLCYVNNFAQPHMPFALQLPAGAGARLCQSMRLLVEELSAAIPAAFESEEYHAKVEEVQTDFSAREEQAMKDLGDEAQARQIALLRTSNGFGFAPLKDGEVIKPDDYDKLPEVEKAHVEARIAELQGRLERILRHDIPTWKRDARDRLKRLNRMTTLAAVEHLVDELRRAYSTIPQIQEYLDSVQQDVIDNVNDFRRSEEGGGGRSVQTIPSSAAIESMCWWTTPRPGAPRWCLTTIRCITI